MMIRLSIKPPLSLTFLIIFYDSILFVVYAILMYQSVVGGLFSDHVNVLGRILYSTKLSLNGCCL